MKLKFIICAVLAISVVSLIVNAETKKFQIEEGWNLISYNVIEEIPMDSVTDNMYLFYLNPNTKEYIGGQLIASDTWNKIGLSISDPLAELQGFWLYSDVPISVNLLLNDEAGINNEIKDISKVDVHLYGGWNFLGIDDVILGKSLLGIKGSCEYISVYLFANGGWIEYTEEILEKRVPLSQDGIGLSWAVKVKNNCKLDFKGEVGVPQAPSLPR